MACIIGCFKQRNVPRSNLHSASTTPGESGSSPLAKVPGAVLQASCPVAHNEVSTRGQKEADTNREKKCSASCQTLDIVKHLHELQVALISVEGGGFETRAPQLMSCIHEHLGPESVVRLLGLTSSGADSASGPVLRYHLVQLAASSAQGPGRPACRYDSLPGRYFRLSSYSGPAAPSVHTMRGLPRDTTQAALLMERALEGKSPALHLIDRGSCNTQAPASGRQGAEQPAPHSDLPPRGAAPAVRPPSGPYIQSLPVCLGGRVPLAASPPPSPLPPAAGPPSHPRDCLAELAALPGTSSVTFAALPLSVGRCQVGVLWIALREPEEEEAAKEPQERCHYGDSPVTDSPDEPSQRTRLGLAMLHDRAVLSQLALSVSMALAVAVPDPDYVSWLAGSVRQLAKCGNLHTLVAGVCTAMARHVRWRFHADVAVQSALVPEPDSPVAFMLYPETKAQGGGSGAMGFAPALHSGTASANGFTRTDGGEKPPRARPQSSDPQFQHCGPSGATAAVRTAPTRAAPVVPTVGPRQSPLPACNPRDPPAASDSAASMAPQQPFSSFNIAAGVPTVSVSGNLTVLALSAKAFQTSHTLLLRLITTSNLCHRDGQPRTAPSMLTLTESMGIEATSTVALARAATTARETAPPRGPYGIIVPDTARHVADVRQPSRDICMLLRSKSANIAAAATAWNPSGATGATSGGGEGYGSTGGREQGSGRRGAASLVLMALEVAEGGCLLGLYISFPAPMPSPLLAAVRDSCGHFIKQMLADLLWHKLCTPELIADFETLRAGVPGSFVSSSGPRYVVDQRGTLQPQASAAPGASSPRATAGPTSAFKALSGMAVTRETVLRMGLFGGVLGSSGPPGWSGSPPVSRNSSRLAPSSLRTGGLNVDVSSSVTGPGASNGGCFLGSFALPWDIEASGTAAGPSGELALPLESAADGGTDPPAAMVTVHDLDAAWGMRGIMGALVDSIMATLRASVGDRQQGENGNDLPARATEGLEDLHLIEVLGHGASGVVLQGLLGTVPVAVKLMEMPDVDQEQPSGAYSLMAPNASGAPNRQYLTNQADQPTPDAVVRSLASMLEAIQYTPPRGSGTAHAVPTSAPGTDEPLPDTGAAGPGDGGAGGGGGCGFGAGLPHPTESIQVRARRTMMRNATELAVMRTVSHVNIVQAFAVYDNVIMERTADDLNGFHLRRLDAKNPETGGSPICTAIVQELCDCGSLADVLSARTFPTLVPVGPGAASLSIRTALHGDLTHPGSGRHGGLQGCVWPGGAGTSDAAGRRGGGASRMEVDLRGVYLTLLEIALALRHLHARRLVHRDLKPANILLKSSPSDPRGWTCKLADFGFALVLDQQDSSLESSRDCSEAAAAPLLAGLPGRLPGSGSAGSAPRGWCTIQAQACGTVTYMAPEAMVKHSRIDASVDIFSFGVICWELVCGRGHRPLRNLEPDDIPDAVRAGARPVFPTDVPPAYRKLATACWAQDPQRRPRAADVVSYIKGQLSQLQEHHR